MADPQGLGGAQLLVVADEVILARTAARLIVDGLANAVRERGQAHIALTGGSSAVHLYEALRDEEFRNAVDWQRVHLWWGDERFVPIDHPESNAGLTYRLLLGMPDRAAESGDGGQAADIAAGAIPAVDVQVEHVHPVEVDETLSDSEPVALAAELYARDLRRFVTLGHGGVPIFDVLLTGIGPDGHIMSLFPGSPGLAPDAPIALGIPAPQHVEPHIDRVTLSARVLPVAHLVVPMTSGRGKADIVARILDGERDPVQLPAQAALLPNAVWLLDRAAASLTGAAPR